MIYLDTSVALAHLLSEDRRPPLELWFEDLVSSRLLEYELWTRLHARSLSRSHGDAARVLVAGLALVELSPSSSGGRWTRFRPESAPLMRCTWPRLPGCGTAART